MATIVEVKRILVSLNDVGSWELHPDVDTLEVSDFPGKDDPFLVVIEGVDEATEWELLATNPKLVDCDWTDTVPDGLDRDLLESYDLAGFRELVEALP
jgi:hypothetical protein